MTAQRQITNIVLLVHPFYSLFADYYGYSDKIDKRLLRRNLATLTTLWRNEIRKAAKNPRAFVIIVKPVIGTNNWFEPFFNKFLNYCGLKPTGSDS